MVLSRCPRELKFRMNEERTLEKKKSIVCYIDTSSHVFS